MNHPYPPSLNDAGDWSFTTGSGVLMITISLLLLTLLRKRNTAGIHILIAGCSFLSLTAWNDWPAADVRGSYYSRTSLLDVWLLRGAVTLALITNIRTLQLWSRQSSNTVWYQILAIYGVAFLAVINQTALCPPEAPWRSRCRNNLKLLGLALHNYHDVWAEFPPLAAGTPPVSWRVQLLPDIGEVGLHRAYDVTSPWNSAANFPLIGQQPAAFRCPTARAHLGETRSQYTDYLGLEHNSSVLQSGRSLRLEDITDGASTTLMIVEACGSQVIWTEPRDARVDDLTLQVNAPGHQVGQSDGLMSSWHAGCAQGLLADGSVHTFSESTDPRILKALATAAGGEGPVSEDDWAP